jgi:hypothetical protein
LSSPPAWLVLLTLAFVLTIGGAAEARMETETQSVTPIGHRFHLKKRLHIRGATVSAECIPGSSTVGVAYRCFAGHRIYDPCWPGRNRAGFVRFYCLLRPWDHAVKRLSVDTFQILPHSAHASRTAPWGIRLTNGQRCVLSPGANDQVEGVPILWSCSGRVSLLADIDRSTRLWTITAVRHDAQWNYTSLGRQHITKAWYGKRARTP